MELEIFSFEPALTWTLKKEDSLNIFWRMKFIWSCLIMCCILYFMVILSFMQIMDNKASIAGQTLIIYIYMIYKP